jgi:hypothetical protein
MSYINYIRQKFEWSENESLDEYLSRINQISDLGNYEYTIVIKLHIQQISTMRKLILKTCLDNNHTYTSLNSILHDLSRKFETDNIKTAQDFNKIVSVDLPNIADELILYISTTDFVNINQNLINYIGKLDIDKIILNKQLEKSYHDVVYYNRSLTYPMVGL